MLFLGFAGLQTLDALTTLWFLQRGLTEANPLLRLAFHASFHPAAALTAAKILSVAAAWWAWRSGRRRLLLRMNLLFSGCVVWNLLALGVSRLQ